MSLPTAPKRFYKAVSTIETEGGFAVCLDGRIPRTPAKNALVLPNQAAAKLVASEWDAQIELITPASMPITRLCNVAIDRGYLTREALIEEVVKYARTDLVCYRAPSPKTLLEAQCAAWDPLMDWAGKNHHIKLTTTFDALAIAQPAPSLTALRDAIEGHDIWHLTALAFATGLAGSAIVAFALVNGFIDGETAFKAIRVEEDWQATRWGVDPDEALIASARRLDLVGAGQLCAALKENTL